MSLDVGCLMKYTSSGTDIELCHIQCVSQRDVLMGSPTPGDTIFNSANSESEHQRRMASLRCTCDRVVL